MAESCYVMDEGGDLSRAYYHSQRLQDPMQALCCEASRACRVSALPDPGELTLGDAHRGHVVGDDGTDTASDDLFQPKAAQWVRVVGGGHEPLTVRERDGEGEATWSGVARLHSPMN